MRRVQILTNLATGVRDGHGVAKAVTLWWGSRVSDGSKFSQIWLQECGLDRL